MKLLRPRDTARALGVSLGTVWRLRREDATFPQPFRISPNSVAFSEDEIAAWLETRRMVRRVEPDTATAR